VQDHSGRGPQFFERRHTADVIQMGVRQRDRLKFQFLIFERGDDSCGLISRINADRPSGFLATDDARVLLKCRHGNLFDDHR
jgi:hypothetical protein